MIDLADEYFSYRAAQIGILEPLSFPRFQTVEQFALQVFRLA